MTPAVRPAVPAPARRATPGVPGRRRTTGSPTLRFERRLLRGGATSLASMDEVGRGAPAGPVHVGVVVVGHDSPAAPPGVRDSKLLAPSAREALVPAIEGWAVAWAVGSAGPGEVDEFGVVGALRLAGLRALATLDREPDLVLLDGSHDWLTDAGGPAGPPVVTRVKADLTCASVAAASILAKVARDAVMTELAGDYPRYGFAANKGYGTPDHLAALQRLGPTPHHRVSWRLPGRD